MIAFVDEAGENVLTHNGLTPLRMGVHQSNLVVKHGYSDALWHTMQSKAAGVYVLPVPLKFIEAHVGGLYEQESERSP